MGVGVQREGGVGVAQDTGQRFGIHTAGEGVGCEGMTQIMKADAGQPRPPEQRLHVEVGRAGVDRILRLHWVGEYPLTDGIRLAPPQDVRHAVRQDDGTHTLIGLRLADSVFALPLAVESAAHLQRTGIPVEVAPLQTADLAAAQAGHQLRLEEVPPHLVLLHHCKEVVQLRTGEDTLGLVVRLGRSRTLGGVSWNDMRLHRVFQCGVECGMDVAHHGVGELMPHLGMLVDAPLRFQAAVHPLDVLLGDEGDLLVAQLRLDVSAAVENGYIVFETNHLSQYGIIATNTGNGTKSPQTGDNSNLALWFAVLFISGGVLTVFSIASKKKRVGINK